jgi:hypothetical protein
MASDIKLIGDNVIIEGSVCVGTSTPLRPLHVEGSEIHSGGKWGGFSFEDRTDKNQRWVWYAMGGLARLWIGSDKITIDPNGVLDADVGRFGNCYVKNVLSGSYVGRSELRISNERVLLRNPNMRSGGTALAHTLNNELSINDDGGYAGGVWIKGKVILDGNVHVNGVLTQSSSREVKENITPFSGREAMQALGELNPVKFFYKGGESKEQRVGFVAEESPGLVTDSGRKGVAVMDVVAVLTKVVQQQQELISQLGAEVKELRQKCEQLPGAHAPEARKA